jgi:hypothetical protein
MNPPSVVLAHVGVFDPQLPVNGHGELVERVDGSRMILLVHGPGLVPEYRLPEGLEGLLYFGPLEPVREDQLVKVVRRTEEGLVRGEAEVFCEEDKVRNEPVAEPRGHS